VTTTLSAEAGLSGEAGLCGEAPLSGEARRAAQLDALRRDFPRYRFERQMFGGEEHYTAQRLAGQPEARPYSVTTPNLVKLRHELTVGRHLGPR
jgi:hypothetical protein